MMARRSAPAKDDPNIFAACRQAPPAGPSTEREIFLAFIAATRTA